MGINDYGYELNSTSNILLQNDFGCKKPTNVDVALKKSK